MTCARCHMYLVQVSYYTFLLTFFRLHRTTLLTFFKHPGALGSHVRFLGAHARTQHRRECLRTRRTEAYAHHHTHARTPAHTRTPQYPGARQGLEPPAGELPSSGVTTELEAHPHNSYTHNARVHSPLWTHVRKSYPYEHLQRLRRQILKIDEVTTDALL